jgi:hypothetical protein
MKLSIISDKDLYRNPRHAPAEKWRNKEIVQDRLRENGKNMISYDRMKTQNNDILDRSIDIKSNKEILQATMRSYNNLNKTLVEKELHIHNFELTP